MIDDDMFELPDSDLDDDEQLSAIEEEQLNVINQIEKYVKEVKENIKYKEKGEYKTNFRVLARYISQMAELNELETNSEGEKLSDEEILAKIKEIEMTVKEVSVADLRPVELDDEEGKKLGLDEITKKDDDDGATDW